LKVLSRRGTISSAKGSNRGFYIETKSGDIALIEIVKGIDGGDFFLRCGLGIKNCPEKNHAPSIMNTRPSGKI